MGVYHVIVSKLGWRGVVAPTLLMFDDFRFGISWLRLEIGGRERGKEGENGDDDGERKSRRREVGD